MHTVPTSANKMAIAPHNAESSPVVERSLRETTVVLVLVPVLDEPSLPESPPGIGVGVDLPRSKSRAHKRHRNSHVGPPSPYINVQSARA